MILVTGASGNVGGHVVRLLLAAGERVRALTRHPDSVTLPAGVEVVAGDLAQPSTLSGAFEGIERMFLFPVAQTAAEVVTSAAAAGVRRVVLLSSAAAVDSRSDHPIAVRHRTVEQGVAASGLDWTFVRPGRFAANTLSWAPSIRAERVVRAPFPDARVNPIHEADIAAVATTALLEDGHVGAQYELTGPEVLTQADQVAAIGAAIGREVRFEEQTREQARAAMLRSMPEPVVEVLLNSMVGAEPRTLPTVEQVTGQPARTYAQWATDNAAVFA